MSFVITSHFWQRYGLAVVLIALTTLISLGLRGLIEPIPAALFFAAVCVSAMYGGVGPGVVASLLSVLAVFFLFLNFGRPLASVTARDLLEIGVILAVMLLITVLTAARKQSEINAHREREQLRVTLTSIGDGVITTDDQGRVVLMNGVAQTLTGWQQAEAVGHPIEEVFRIIDEETRTAVENPIRHALRDGVLGGLAKPALLVAKTGKEIPIDDSSAPIRDDQGILAGGVLVFRDITERKRAELARRLLVEAGHLLASSLDYRERLANLTRLVVPTLADWCAVDVLDPDGAIRRVAVAHVDPAKVELAHELQQRYPVDPQAPRGVPQVLRTGEAEFYPQILESVLEAATSDPEVLKILRELGLKSGMTVPLIGRERALGALTLVMAESGRTYDQADLHLAEELARRAALALEDAQLYAETQMLNAQLEDRILERTRQLRATVNELRREINERQLAEEALHRSREQLRRLSARLQAVREEERTHMAREIHDQLGGAMTGLKMDVAALRRNLQATLLEKSGAISGLIDDTIQTVRRIATELRPAILDDFGLLAAIEWQLQEFQTRANIECNLSAEMENIPLDPERSTALFRVFQETLTNVARHANATRVEVQLSEQDGQLILQVRDNGRGISDEEISGSKSLGLVGMQERIHLLSGELDIRGTPGQGTTVFVKIPMGQTKPDNNKSGGL